MATPAYNDGNVTTKVNDRFWFGPNAAGMGKATVPDGADDGNGARLTTYQGRNNIGHNRNQPGPNVAGAPKAITQPA